MKTFNKPKILIVGAGIAGLTLSAYLKKQEFEITVIEKTKQWDLIGYPILIWQNGIFCLKKLDLDKKVINKSFAVNNFNIYNGNEDCLISVDLKEFNKKLGSVVEVHRADLHNILLKKNYDTKILMNTHITKLNKLRNGISVELNNKRKEIFDLIVGADGINSQIRKNIFPEIKPKSLGWTGWWFWLSSTKLSPKVSAYFGNGFFFGVFPHGNKKRLAAYYGIPGKHNSKETLKQGIKRLEDKGSILIQVLESLDNNFDKPFHFEHQQIDANKWYEGRTVLIGDSAHAMSPHTGMGASMAMEDAYVLSEELSMNKNDINKALENYFSRRYKRVKKMKDYSKIINKVLSIKSPFYNLRNIFLRRIIKKHFLKTFEKFINVNI